MSIVVYILLAVVLLIMFAAALIMLNAVRTKGSIARSLDLQLMLFTVPRMGPGQQQQPDDKKLISLMEQLFSAISTFRVKGWNKFLYGDPYIALEMAVHHIGEQIHFYAAVPSKYADQFEKQVSGVFPSAQIARSPDYSIFNPGGASAGAFLTLNENSILPFQTYNELPTDPLGPIAAALARLENEGEGASLQMIVRPSSDNRVRKLAMDTAHHMQTGVDFKKALKMAKSPPKKDKGKEETLVQPPKVATEFENRVIKSLQNKASRPLFDCNVRVLSSAPTPERAAQILNDIAGAFSQYAAPDLNAFKLKALKGRDLDKLVFNYSFRLFDQSQTIQLSSEEVTSIYHFPVSSAVLPRVKFANFRTAPPPPDMPQEGVVFGMNVYQGIETPLKLTKEARRRHMYIIGQTGTGKSVTMAQMIYQDLRNGEGVTIIEPHIDLGSKALRHVPKERIDDVIYFDPTNIDRPMGLNLLEFDPAHPEQKTLIIDELFQIMDKLYDLKTTGGPQFERYFKNSIFLLLDNYERRIPTLADVSRVFVDEAFRNDLLAHESNPIVKNFWELEATKTTGDQSLANFAGYVTSKIDAFTSNDFLRPIVNQQKSAFDFADIIENRKILICNLAKGKIGQMNSDLLGLVILNKLQRAALARDIRRTEFPDHYVYIDEFQNYATPSIKTILSEARKYKMCLIMAHQYVTQLPEDIRDAIYGNVGTFLIARISPEDAETPKIKTRFEPIFTPFDISNIDNLNAYVSMLVGQALARPTSCRLMLQELIADPGDPKMEETLIQISHLKFGRPRAEVEAEILGRFTNPNA